MCVRVFVYVYALGCIGAFVREDGAPLFLSLSSLLFLSLSLSIYIYIVYICVCVCVCVCVYEHQILYRRLCVSVHACVGGRGDRVP